MSSFERAYNQGQIPNYIIKPITSERTKTRVGSMRSKDGQTKSLLMPSYQSEIIGINRSCNTITLAPAAPANSLTGQQNIYQFLLQPGSITEKVNGMRLTLQVSNTSNSQSVTMVPWVYKELKYIMEAMS